MNTGSELLLAHRAVRKEICDACPHRPAGSEHWGLRVPRICEQVCPLFIPLPQLLEIARDPRAHSAAAPHCRTPEDMCPPPPAPPRANLEHRNVTDRVPRQVTPFAALERVLDRCPRL